MAIPGDHGHLDAHNQWLQFIDDVVNHKIYPGPAGPVGPVGPVGPKGEQGNDGQGLKIDGFYKTYAEFIAAHPTGVAGDSFLVGSDLYIWNPSLQGWQNCGPVQGPEGKQGEPGVAGKDGAKGDQGPQGPAGPQGPQGVKGDPGASGVAKAIAPIHVDDATDTVSLNQAELNVTLDARYVQPSALAVKADKTYVDTSLAAKADKSSLDAKANITGATFTGSVNVVSPAAAVSSGVRQTFISTSSPASTDGKDGDIWMVYAQ